MRTASPGFPAPFLVQQTWLLQVARLLSCVLLTYMLLTCMIADCTCVSSVDGEWAEMGCALGIWTQGFRVARSYLSGFPELICALTTAICSRACGRLPGSWSTSPHSGMQGVPQHRDGQHEPARLDSPHGKPRRALHAFKSIKQAAQTAQTPICRSSSRCRQVRARPVCRNASLRTLSFQPQPDECGCRCCRRP